MVLLRKGVVLRGQYRLYYSVTRHVTAGHAIHCLSKDLKKFPTRQARLGQQRNATPALCGALMAVPGFSSSGVVTC